MARNVSVDRSQSEQSQGQGRSLSRHDDYYFPSLSGDLFSLSPFALLREMTDWMDRSYTGSPSRGAGASQMWAPTLEVRKKDNNLVVCADLPGSDSKDVKVEVDNDTLISQGERKHEQTPAGDLRREPRRLATSSRADCTGRRISSGGSVLAA